MQDCRLDAGIEYGERQGFGISMVQEPEVKTFERACLGGQDLTPPEMRLSPAAA